MATRPAGHGRGAAIRTCPGGTEANRASRRAPRAARSSPCIRIACSWRHGPESNTQASARKAVGVYRREACVGRHAAKGPQRPQRPTAEAKTCSHAWHQHRHQWRWWWWCSGRAKGTQAGEYDWREKKGTLPRRSQEEPEFQAGQGEQS